MFDTSQVVVRVSCGAASAVAWDIAIKRYGAVTMCYGKELDDSRECPRRRTCYRACAEPSKHRQSYFAILPMADDGTCHCFKELRTSPSNAGPG